jgi:hypothetical protein
VQPLWKSIWRFVKNLKLELPYDPAVPLVSVYVKESQSAYCRDTCAPKFTVVLFTIARLGNQSRSTSTDELIKKTWFIYSVVYIKKS